MAAFATAATVSATTVSAAAAFAAAATAASMVSKDLATAIALACTTAPSRYRPRAVQTRFKSSERRGTAPRSRFIVGHAQHEHVTWSPARGPRTRDMDVAAGDAQAAAPEVAPEATPVEVPVDAPATSPQQGKHHHDGPFREVS